MKKLIEQNYITYLKNPWPYIAGGVLLAVFNIAHTIMTGGQPWSVSGTFGNWGAAIVQLFGGNPNNWDYFIETGRNFTKYKFWEDSGTIRNIGIIIGALLASLIGTQFKFKKIKSIKQVVGAVTGGLLMGYGARLAFGCNIGAMFSAVPSLSLHGYIFLICAFIGAVAGGKLLVKYLL